MHSSSDQAPPPAGETTHAIALNGRTVSYLLRRSGRRSIGLSIDDRGLRVGAPPRTTIAEIERLIRRHGDWVTQKLDEWRNRPRPLPQTIVDGAEIPYLGGMLKLHLTQGGNQICWEHDGNGDDAWDEGDKTAAHKGSAPANGETAHRPDLTHLPRLTLAARSPDSAPRLLERALRLRAMTLFRARLVHFSRQFGLAAPPLSLSAARTRWGSCSLRTGIRLNWRLIHYRPALIDYVVIHELAHLREMNHSARFWAIVERHCPDYRQLRKELKRLSTGAP